MENPKIDENNNIEEKNKEKDKEKNKDKNKDKKKEKKKEKKKDKEKNKEKDKEEDKEKDKKKSKFKSKWLKLKKKIENKSSYESSVKLLKRKTIEQFASKCCEIYKEKIEIHLLRKKNEQFLSSWIKDKNKDKEAAYSYPNIEIKKDLSDLCENSSIQDFLFYFRENNEYMLKLITNLSKEKRKTIIPFLCHFFYENFFMESPEQEEILYIIYLLLEKEIDSLYSPSVLSFLEDTFMGEFLAEMGNKYEISKYIDNILNTLIREVEEKNTFFNSLDIIHNSKKHYEYYKSDNSFFDMNCQESIESSTDNVCKKDPIKLDEDLNTNKSMHVNKNFQKRKTSILEKLKINNIRTSSNIENLTNVNNIHFENIPFKNFINKNFFENINENNLKKLLENEKNDIMKSFYIKQINILNINKNPNFFNSNIYYEKMKEKKIISKLSIEQFNKCVDIIINFIDKLFSNLENIIIIPYNIKAICKFIDILINKKFKNISRIQCNSLISRFLFDKLIFPVLENPDINNCAKEMILSLNTRKILIYTYEVIKKIIRGELFNCEQNKNYTVFNKYIIQNFNRFNNIINKIIDVKIPEKLLLLSNKFYENDNFCLDNVVRQKQEINYNYFEENPTDFMQHKSICFNINQFLLFYGIVHINHKIFFENNKYFENLFRDVTKHISSMECSISSYYVIIKDEYSNEINELLNLKEKNIKLCKAKNKEETLFKLKFCIRHLFSNLKILHYWDWINNEYTTKQTFEFIHKYLTFYGDKCSIPLNWYTQFILNNLSSISQEYIDNDYKLLSKEIKQDVKNILKKLKKLYEFLTVNMTTKFYLIENKKKCFKRELENVKRTQLNIKALLFIELSEIKICLMNGFDYKKFTQFDEKPKINNSSIIICKQQFCPHSESSNSFNKHYNKKYHCKNVKEFADKFSIFNEVISEEIINYSFGPDFYNSNKTLFGDFDQEDKLKDENIIITESPKKILETYMNLVSAELKENIIFNSFQKNGFEIIITEEEQIELENNNPKEALKLKKEKEDREKVLNIVWNYILKSLCNKIYESKPLFVDQIFNLRCASLSSFVKPENLNIPKEIVNEQILNKVESHVEKINELRTPGGIIEEFGTVVHLINLLYKFFLNIEQTEAGDLLPVIIYCIISVKPKRIIFNVNFSKFFLSQKDLLGGIGYKMTQAESSINFIKKLEAKQIGISQEEFNKQCSTIKFK